MSLLSLQAYRFARKKRSDKQHLLAIIAQEQQRREQTFQVIKQQVTHNLAELSRTIGLVPQRAGLSADPAPATRPTENVMAAAKKSLRQVRFLLSKGSPLTATAKNRLKRELHTGAVKVVKKKRKKKT